LGANGDQELQLVLGAIFEFVGHRAGTVGIEVDVQPSTLARLDLELAGRYLKNRNVLRKTMIFHPRAEILPQTLPCLVVLVFHFDDLDLTNNKNISSRFYFARTIMQMPGDPTETPVGVVIENLKADSHRLS
jgi:hypothetical protein